MVNRIWILSTIIIILKLCQCNELGSLIDGVIPLEEIRINGELVNSEDGDVTVDRSDDGQLTLVYSGEGIVSVTRSTGLASGSAKQLLQLAQNSLRTRFHLIAALKRGGRILTPRSTEKFEEILRGCGQKIDIYMNDKLVDLSKASVIEVDDESKTLEPEGRPGVRITMSDSGVSVTTTSGAGELKIVFSKGLSEKQVHKLRDNFYGIVAERASQITGIPKQLIEFTMAGRDVIADRLGQILKPTEIVHIGNENVNLDKTKREMTPGGEVLEPQLFPKVKITWKNNDILRVDSKDGTSINAIYSKGVESVVIKRLVEGLHRAFTRRIGMISWSNKFFGSIPSELESIIDELKKKVQKRTIYINGKEVDLKHSSVIAYTDNAVLFRLPNGDKLKTFMDGSVSSPGGHPISVELSPGISETQLAQLLDRINKIFTTSLSFTSDTGEALFNFEQNRDLIESLTRGIKQKEKIKVDGDIVEASNATTSKEDLDWTEYSIEGLDDVALTKFNDGHVQVSGKGRTVFISRSTGLSLDFLNRLVMAINNVMPKKRWFYNFGTKGVKERERGKQLRSIILEEIPTLVHNKTVSIDGRQVDLSKASIVSADDSSTVYSPDGDPKTKITNFVNGDIEAFTEEKPVSVKVSNGITTADAVTLVDNIKKIVGDRFKIDPVKPGDVWCSTGDLRKLLIWLVNKIFPCANISFDQADGTVSEVITASSRRDFSADEAGGNVLTVSEYEVVGKNVTARNSGKFNLKISTGLTQESAGELIQFLNGLLRNKEEVIKMVTGSLGEIKIHKIKTLIKSMIQRQVIQIDSEFVPNNRALSRGDKRLWLSPDKKKVLVETNDDGSIDVNGVEDHVVSVSVGPGLTTQQAVQLFVNIRMAFREKFAEISGIPVQCIEFVSNVKKYFMKSFFYSAAPPKEFIYVNGVELLVKNSSVNDLAYVEETDGLENPVMISRLTDGSLEVTAPKGGTVQVTRSTGLSDELIDRVLRAVEFKLGLKNKMFRISSDELFSPPDRLESLESLLKALVSKERLFVDGREVDTSRPARVSTEGVCKLHWFDQARDLVLKRCSDGLVSADYRRSRSVSLRISTGITEGQSEYLLKTLMTTIRTKSSNVKHLVNYPDTFLLLLADGRLHSLEKILLTLIPREDIVVDGRRINLGPIEMGPDDDYQFMEFDSHPGLEILRYRNESLNIRLWNGGRLDVHLNSGLSPKLVSLVMDKLKGETTNNLTPYLDMLDRTVKGDSSSLVSLTDEARRIKSTGRFNGSLFLDALQNEFKSRIHQLSLNSNLSNEVADKIIQTQQIYVDDQQIDMNQASVTVSRDSYVTYSPPHRDHVTITSFDSGRLIVDSLKEETISVTVSNGVPRKMLMSLAETVTKYINKIDSDDAFTSKIRSSLTNHLSNLYDSATRGIESRREISLDDAKIELKDDLLVRSTDLTLVYKYDDVMISLEKDGSTGLELMKAGKLELDLSSGLLSKPIITFLSDNSLKLLSEAYQSFSHSESMAPVTTKVIKTFEKLLESLRQRILIDGELIKSSHSTSDTSAIKLRNSPDVEISVDKSGKVTVIKGRSDSPTRILVSSGLSQSDVDRLVSNMETLLSDVNPVQLVADFFDLLPKNFFLLAQNMDRVLSIMNLIKF